MSIRLEKNELKKQRYTISMKKFRYSEVSDAKDYVESLDDCYPFLKNCPFFYDASKYSRSESEKMFSVTTEEQKRLSEALDIEDAIINLDVCVHHSTLKKYKNMLKNLKSDEMLIASLHLLN